MPNVVFALPYGLPATLRFLEAVVRLNDVRVAVVSQEDADRVPAPLRDKLAGHRRVRDVLSADDLEAAVRELASGARVDALVGILEPMQEAMAEVRRRLRIPGMDPETARNFRNKAHMKEQFRAHGIPCARHALAHSVDEGVRLGLECGLPVVIKPPDGAGARSTWRADDPQTLRRCLELARPTPSAPALVEEFVRGTEHSFDSLSLDGRHLLHSISHYSPTPLEVMQNPWIQWCVLLPRHIDGPEYDDIRAAGGRALDALGMRTGISHMEWFRREDGTLAISEVAARPPGAQFTSLLSYAYDVNFYRLWAELVCLGRCEVPSRRFSTGAVFLRGQEIHRDAGVGGAGVGGAGVGGAGSRSAESQERRVRVVHGLARAREEVGDVVVEANIPEPGQAAATSYEGEGYVLVRHEDTATVERAMKRILDTVRVELNR